MATKSSQRVVEARQAPAGRVPMVAAEGKPSPTSLSTQFNTLPKWRRGNRHILSGYRSSATTYSDAFASLTYLHNQTVNIYSHLLSVPLLLICAGLFHQLREIPLTSSDYVVFSLFIAGASNCFLLSATFHVLFCHSAAVHNWWVRLDYVGIVVITTTTFLAGEYYLFLCDSVRMVSHFTLTTTLGIATVLVLLVPTFQSQEWRTFRLTCFCFMGVSGFVPMIDSLLHYGWEHSARYSIRYYLFEMFLELCGATTYGSRIPERWRPGRFDIWGASHQWFHFFSAAAALVHLAGLVNAVEKTRAFDRCAG